MGGIELKNESKPILLKNRQLFDTESVSQLSEFDPVADPLTINLNNNRLERNSCCGDDDKSDNGLDSTQNMSEIEADIIPVRKYKAPKSRRDASSVNGSFVQCFAKRQVQSLLHQDEMYEYE